jgi:hypothetical protein
MAGFARALALLWAGFWMVFVVAESWAWHTPVPVALPWVSVGLLFVLLALVPWRWEVTGGLLLVIAGLSAGVADAIWSAEQVPVASRAATVVVLGGPPLAAGLLFLMRHAASARA